MDPLVGVAIVIGVLYLAYTSGGLTSLGVPPPGASPLSPGINPLIPPPTTIAARPPGGLQSNVSMSAPVITTPPGQTTGVNKIGLITTAATSVATAAVSTPASFAALGLSGAAAGAALAGIGAVAAIAAALLIAHEQRKKQAQNENQATNLGVQGYDSGLKQINAAYNARQIDAAGAAQLVQQVISQYWAEVTPQIQPGRNGCNGGSGCPPWPANGNGCSGSIGAACCVGCYDLAGGTSPHVFGPSDGGDNSTPYYFGIQGTLIVLSHGGGKVLYQTVVGSKYGGQNRQGYILNWIQVSAA